MINLSILHRHHVRFFLIRRKTFIHAPNNHTRIDMQLSKCTSCIVSLRTLDRSKSFDTLPNSWRLLCDCWAACRQCCSHMQRTESRTPTPARFGCVEQLSPPWQPSCRAIVEVWTRLNYSELKSYISSIDLTNSAEPAFFGILAWHGMTVFRFSSRSSHTCRFQRGTAAGGSTGWLWAAAHPVFPQKWWHPELRFSLAKGGKGMWTQNLPTNLAPLIMVFAALW